ncbi:homoprotocatechuate degradation operon regulator, HpaR [Variovorax sp. PBL-H6]|uniref:MarR family winged helix-turn-helix transcriptional regulator n=1 Tax=Variovorax sp. PBL-H6 TaxID=434009 RepID=UPI001319078F|nr:helix-turn-helix domain-containing protein [Variovorax sp. PBL-H6]VTU26706.1 homoprotocatechuate degradation operon regulator, HpaR [Variovorax sp. PBL-H6]
MKKVPLDAKLQPSLHGLLQRAHREATSELRRLAGTEGVPVEFWRVLEVLADEQGRSMSALAAATGMQMPATSKLIDRMVDAALVQRSLDPADLRRVVLYISDFGLQKVDALRGDMERHRQRLAQTLGAARERELRGLLEDFIRAHRRETG